MIPVFFSKQYLDLFPFLTCFDFQNYRIFGEIKFDTLYSPGRATFGGFSKLQEYIEEESDKSFLLHEFFKNYPNFSKVIIYFPPTGLYKSIVSQNELISYKNQKIVVEDINQYINISRTFLSSYSKGNRKKVNQFFSRGGFIKKVGTNEIKDVYNILERNRANRGVVLSMSLEILKEKVASLPNNYEIFLAALNNEFVAAAVVVNIDDIHRYVLFWGDLPESRSTSPIASLATHIIDESLQRNFKILDLGISSVDGILDEGLYRFKKNLGAVSTSKFKISYIRSS